MTGSIDIAPGEHLLVQKILRELLPDGAHVWVFGSRATGRARPASDLDLAVDVGRALTLSETARLAEAFDESPLPYNVDLVDLHTAHAAFRKIIERDRIGWPVQHN